MIARAKARTEEQDPMSINPDQIPMKTNLEHVVDNHDFWNCRLLDELRSASLTHAELKYFFQEYSYFSVNFTRLLGAALSVMENDRHRAMLSENLWEESGEKELEERHSVIYRKFLKDVFSISEKEIRHSDSIHLGKRYFEKSLAFCSTHSALETTAFICYGVEGVVSQLYQYFVKSLKPYIKKQSDLHFFKLHIGCDDEHTETLQKMLVDYKDDPKWDEKCLGAIEAAFQLKIEFFDAVYANIQSARVDSIINLAGDYRATSVNHTALNDFSEEVYSQDKGNTAFSVFRSEIDSSIMDVRRVAIAPGKSNESHSHGHETILYVCEGSGRVEIEAKQTDINVGDVIFVPRWLEHRTDNTGKSDMLLMAITDSKLISKFTQETDRSYRNKSVNDVTKSVKPKFEEVLVN